MSEEKQTVIVKVVLNHSGEADKLAQSVARELKLQFGSIVARVSFIINHHLDVSWEEIDLSKDLSRGASVALIGHKCAFIGRPRACSECGASPFDSAPEAFTRVVNPLWIDKWDGPR